MTIDQIILIVALIVLFALIFGSVYFLPIIFAKIRSNVLGLKIDFRQAKLLAKKQCLTKEFIIGVKEIWEIYPVKLDKLVSHYFAGGNLNNLKSGISEMNKRNKEPDINMLTIFDLAKRDLKAEVEKAEKKDWKFEF
jgi:uncharacterized protein YqfA (UPF0365 family)